MMYLFKVLNIKCNSKYKILNIVHAKHFKSENLNLSTFQNGKFSEYWCNGTEGKFHTWPHVNCRNQNIGSLNMLNYLQPISVGGSHLLDVSLCSHNNPNLKKVTNLKFFWSQAFWISCIQSLPAMWTGIAHYCCCLDSYANLPQI